ncbi:MAG: hypothetical protein JW876_07785 [Candidatus Krumholzibacteriota bacterium]|nr:hypothetical protein [Candidatus Krumholzibacteriota bacterium]
MRLRVALVLALAFAAAACGAERADNPLAQGGAPENVSWPRKGVVHWRSFFDWDEKTLSEAAEAEYIVVPTAYCFSPVGVPILARLRELNPDIRVLGYQGVLNQGLLWPDTVYLETTLPFALDIWRAVRDDWAWTDTGDTFQIWPEAIFLDPITGGELNRDLIDEIVSLYERYQQATGYVLDGVFHDYFTDYLYVNWMLEETVEGDPDLDDDGVPFADDPDEQALLVAWQKEYVRAFDERFGSSFLQVANGHLPQVDAELAGMLNGIYYEAFPNNRSGFTDCEGLERLVENCAEGWLRPVGGRTWSITTNDELEQNNWFCLVASLIAGCCYTEHYEGSVFTGWQLAVDCGLPLGPAAREGRPDSILTWRRLFERGEARISFDHSGRRSEVVFEPAAR